MLLIKFMQQQFGLSRRAAIEEVGQRHVMVDGYRDLHPALRLSNGHEVLWREKIRIFGEEESKVKPVYIMFNKPMKLITSRSDDKDRKTVIDYLKMKGVWQPVFPVGRLDYDTRGLLILTTDGDFSLRLTHPKFKIKRVYNVWLDRFGVDDRILEKLRAGVVLDGKKIQLDELTVISKCKTHLRVALHSGQNRVVRRLFEAVGRTVIDLERVSIGDFELGSLRLGNFKYFDLPK